MINDKKILAITPARGGSKGIPRKNIKIIAGKPLLVWTIERALESKLIDKYVVSTEDKEISDVAKKNGAIVVERTMELAHDETKTIDVMIDALNHVDNDFKFSIIVLLQCTSPFRGTNLIDNCIRRFVETGVDSLVTGYDCKLYPYKKSLPTRRQDIKPYFVNDGNVYVIKADLIK
jgi:CMP-N-acetylneuraminic acid synthetase